MPDLNLTDVGYMTTPAEFFEAEISLDVDSPILVSDSKLALAFAVVTRGGRVQLDESWNTGGVYVLLHHTVGEAWSAYVGKAGDRGLLARLREHARLKDDWSVAVLMRRDVDGWLNASHQAWLERHIFLMLAEVSSASLSNGNTPPGDQSIRSSDRATLDAVVDQLLRVLNLVGFRDSVARVSQAPAVSMGSQTPAVVERRTDLSWRAAALRVLEDEAGSSFTAQELVNEIVSRGLRERGSGLTPDATVAAVLYTDMKRPESRVRVDNGRFTLV